MIRLKVKKILKSFQVAIVAQTRRIAILVENAQKSPFNAVGMVLNPLIGTLRLLKYHAYGIWNNRWILFLPK